MALLIRYRALPVSELFNELSRYEFIRRVSEWGNAGRENWVSVTNELTELEDTERGIVKSVGMSLGTSDINGQLSMLEVNSQLLAKQVEIAHEQYIKKGKLYRSAGILAGLFVAILVI